MTRQEFIFTRKLPERLYRHIAFWSIYYLFSLLTYFHPMLEKTTFGKWAILETVEVFWHVLTQMIFCYTILYWLVPQHFDRRRYVSLAGLGLFVAAATYCLSYGEQYFFFSQVHRFAGLHFLSNQLLAWYTLISFISYYPISTGLAIAFRMLKNFYVKQNENQLLTRENASAELQLLKAQVHPHFLFNTLNNIYSFTLNRNMQAPRLIMNLSDTLHYMISDCDAGSVALSKELKMIRDYIDLEQIRYSDRLDLNIEISGVIDNKMVVPLLMIPFIENSFKHGASRMLGEVWINLFIHADEELLHFTLTNNKPPEQSKADKSGIGLNNVKKRLELLYPSNHLLTIDSGINTFTVNMQVPLQVIGHEAITAK